MKIRELNPSLPFCGTALQLAVSLDEGFRISQSDLPPELLLLILLVPPSPWPLSQRTETAAPSSCEGMPSLF